MFVRGVRKLDAIETGMLMDHPMLPDVLERHGTGLVRQRPFSTPSCHDRRCGVSDCSRKRRGIGFGIRCARPRAALSSEVIRAAPHKS